MATRARRAAGRWEMWALASIVLIGAVLRFYRLDQLPPGLHFDEAFNAVNARALLHGSPAQIFYESNMGQEPAIIYLVAAALALAGSAPWVVRLPSAVVGLLTIPLIYWLGRELAASNSRDDRPDRSSETCQVFFGLGTALMLAILYWHVSFSRIGMEPILVPFVAVLAMAALLRGLNTRRWPWMAVAGAALGGSLYTYKAGYFVPVVTAVYVAYWLLINRTLLSPPRGLGSEGRPKGGGETPSPLPQRAVPTRSGAERGRRRGGHSAWRLLAVAALAAAVVVAPLAVYFALHPWAFAHRPGDVVLAAGQAGARGESLASSVGRVLGMFFVRGDANPRSNLPGRPALDPFLAALFVVGLGRAIVDTLRGRSAGALALIWLVVMTVPTLITEYPPHFARAIGATPAVALLCAMGAWTIWQLPGRYLESRTLFADHSPRGRWARGVMSAFLGVGLLFSTARTARDYLGVWGSSPDLFYAYDAGLVDVARRFNAVPPGEAIYLTPTPRDHYTLQFIAAREFSSFDGRDGFVYPPPGRPATVVVLQREDGQTLAALQQARPDGSVSWTIADPWGRPYAAAYHLPARDQPAPQPEYAAAATFGGAARLLGYSLSPAAIEAGEPITLTLCWQALAPLPRDYTAFVHLLGEYNPATNGPLWAGHDSQPDGGHYPTTAWQPGEVILDVHRLALPVDAPGGEYRIEAGLYWLETLERLPAAGSDGQPLPDNAAILGTVEVRTSHAP